MTRFWAEYAHLGGERPERSVVIEIADGRIAAVEAEVAADPGDVRLTGLTLPGMANAHSHLFHRLLRGRTHHDGGSFWTWREAMYRAAQGLDPDLMYRVARATLAEMAQSGFTVVGEFHYLHHRPDGGQYDDPNEMGRAIIAAAAEVGVRLTLLDTLYLRGGIDDDGEYLALAPEQARFADGGAGAWAERVTGLQDADTVRIGAGVHSVRAVSPEDISEVAAWARARGAPLHAHVSEQPKENEQSLAAHGATPTGVLSSAGALDARFTAVHGTHLSEGDRSLLGAAEASVCLCPTTEQDLADGIGPSVALAREGVAIALGTDSHAVIDPFAEMRATEMHARLASGRRGNHSPIELVAMASESGYRSLGWPGGGRIAVGAHADLVTLSLDSVRLAGIGQEDLLAGAALAASASDVGTVVVAGRVIAADGAHVTVDPARELANLMT